MLKGFAAALFAVCIFAGTAEAKGASAAHHKHWPTCTEGAVKATCACRAGMTGHYQLCHAGHWCHNFIGACTP